MIGGRVQFDPRGRHSQTWPGQVTARPTASEIKASVRRRNGSRSRPTCAAPSSRFDGCKVVGVAVTVTVHTSRANPAPINPESVKSNETSGCLRGLWWLVLLGAGCGRFVDPRVGRHLARPGAAVEPPGVGSVGGVEGGGAAGFDGDPGSVVHRCWGVHRDPGMPVLIIVVPEEVAAEYVDVFDGPEFAGERRAVLEGLEVRLRIRVIIGYVRAGMGLVDAEPRVQPNGLALRSDVVSLRFRGA